MYHPSYTVVQQLMQKYVLKKPYIVDYGCGNGVLIDLIGQNVIGQYEGYEVNDNALKEAKRKYGKKAQTHFYKIKPGILPKFGKKSRVDVVVLIGVLQYLTQSEISHVLARAKYVLRPGGVIIASCVTDHWVYRVANLYRFVLPNFYINREKLIKQARTQKFIIAHNQERGLILGPLFSHGIVLVFDAIDKLLFHNRGKLGPIGITIRKLMKPLMYLELLIPIDYGYTLYLVLKKRA